jgi:hypothetical protein
MGLNFPNAPAVGALYPQPAVAGVPVYRWDGIAWSTQGAPLDKTPVYTDGSTPMTAQLGLITPPTANAHASSKKYVDDSVVAYAAPFDALAYNGMQTNGAFEVSQERTPGTTFVGVGYVCDGWYISSGGPVASSSILVAFASAGIGNVLQNNITTVDAAMAGSSAHTILTYVEGYRARRLGFGYLSAQPLTVAFYSAHHRTGLYSVTLRNADNTRSCVMTYNQVNPDSYQYNIVTFPGCTDGVWNTTNGIGFSCTFTAACGPTFTAPATGVWYPTIYASAPGQVNGAGSTADTFRIASVLILPGTVAPPAARAAYISRPWDQEYILCQRYWWTSNPGNPKGDGAGMLAGVSLIANVISGNTYRFTVPMRIMPALKIWNNGVQGQVRNTSTGAVIAVGAVANNWIELGGGTLINVATLASGIWVDFDLMADARF